MKSGRIFSYPDYLLGWKERFGQEGFSKRIQEPRYWEEEEQMEPMLGKPSAANTHLLENSSHGFQPLPSNKAILYQSNTNIGEGYPVEIRRFGTYNADTNNCFSKLKKKLKKLFPVLQKEEVSFSVLWRDSFGDFITIGSSEELNIALDEMVGSMFTFHIQVKNQNSSPKNITNDLDSKLQENTPTFGFQSSTNPMIQNGSSAYYECGSNNDCSVQVTRFGTDYLNPFSPNYSIEKNPQFARNYTNYTYPFSQNLISNSNNDYTFHPKNFSDTPLNGDSSIFSNLSKEVKSPKANYQNQNGLRKERFLPYFNPGQDRFNKRGNNLTKKRKQKDRRVSKSKFVKKNQSFELQNHSIDKLEPFGFKQLKNSLNEISISNTFTPKNKEVNIANDKLAIVDGSGPSRETSVTPGFGLFIGSKKIFNKKDTNEPRYPYFKEEKENGKENDFSSQNILSSKRIESSSKILPRGFGEEHQSIPTRIEHSSTAPKISDGLGKNSKKVEYEPFNFKRQDSICNRISNLKPLSANEYEPFNFKQKDCISSTREIVPSSHQTSVMNDKESIDSRKATESPATFVSNTEEKRSHCSTRLDAQESEEEKKSSEPGTFQEEKTKFQSQLEAFAGLGYPDEQGWITRLLEENQGDFGKVFTIISEIFDKAYRELDIEPK